jgi:hypothetical protein
MAPRLETDSIGRSDVEEILYDRTSFHHKQAPPAKQCVSCLSCLLRLLNPFSSCRVVAESAEEQERRRSGAEAEIRWRLAIMRASSVHQQMRGRLPLHHPLVPSSLRYGREDFESSSNQLLHRTTKSKTKKAARHPCRQQKQQRC